MAAVIVRFLYCLIAFKEHIFLNKNKDLKKKKKKKDSPEGEESL